MAGKRDKGKAARQQAHLDRIAQSSAGAGDQRRARRRDEAARAAEAGPSAARWLVATADGAESLDVVADLLALDPRTRLRGRGDEQLRALAGAVVDLVAVGAAPPSGRALLDVLVADPQVRAALTPTFDLAALLDDGPVTDRTHDRSVRLAAAMLERATAHRAGEVDLYEQVAPVGTPRHPDGDGLEALVTVGSDDLAALPGPDPAVVTTPDGWLGLSPVEVFFAAGRGLLTGEARDLLGGALYAWMDRAVTDPTDSWWAALTSAVEVDGPALLQQAAARAGSDHPQVAGGVLVEMISLRHTR